MVMENNQILLDYKNAADPKEMVQILADLNQTDVWTMATWLKENGADISLQWFGKWNPKKIAALDAKKNNPPVPKGSEQLRSQIDALTENVAQLTEQIEDLRRERPVRDETDAEKKISRIKYLLDGFYEYVEGNDAATMIMIIDLIAREGDDEG